MIFSQFLLLFDYFHRPFCCNMLPGNDVKYDIWSYEMDFQVISLILA